ncbi:MAG: hypothetical protein HOW73_40895 [Polyangiaceae bacterium]|nr:hypothetical protein [Polyangiaceae bacterium]
MHLRLAFGTLLVAAHAGCAAPRPSDDARGEVVPPASNAHLSTSSADALPSSSSPLDAQAALPTAAEPAVEASVQPVVIDEPVPGPATSAARIARPSKNGNCYIVSCLQKIAGKLPAEACLEGDGGYLTDWNGRTVCHPQDPVCPCLDVLEPCKQAKK